MKHLFDEIAPASTLVVVTHKPALLAHIQRLIVVDKGHIVLDGPRDQVLAQLRPATPTPKASTSVTVSAKTASAIAAKGTPTQTATAPAPGQAA